MIRRFVAQLVLGFALLNSANAAVPAYLRQAIARYHPDAPSGWAFTLTTTRDGKTSRERFDPSRPKGGEWTLLETEGRAPTAQEIERYGRYKASNTPTTNRATFERGDLDLEGASLLREDETHAEFRLKFRESTNQPLLTHVVLDLKVRKATASVESSVLRLFEPFSPALGVRMNSLLVTTTHSAPGADAPSLPQEIVSQFRGRMFFLIPLDEDLRVAYSDFTRVR